MYKLPKDFGLGFVVGRTLENVSFSENTVFFGFGDHVSITAFSSLQHEFLAGAAQPNKQCVPLNESRLMQLPGHSVVKASGDDEGTLTLVFDNGHILRVFKDDPHYECYSINDGKKEIYV
jgi:hypothetical protein